MICKKLLMVMSGLALAAALVLGSCDMGTTEDPQTTEPNEAAKKLEADIKAVKDTAGTYEFVLTEDALNFPGFTLGTSGVTITLKGNGHKITGNWTKQTDKVFASVKTGATLILDNVGIYCTAASTDGFPIVYVPGGTLEIKSGTVISGSGGSNATRNTHCVIINNGTLTMNDGSITGGRDGILLEKDSKFTMSGGTISGNNNGVATYGTGVVFNLNGGTITNNSDTGVAVWSDSENASITLSGTDVIGNKNGIAISGKSPTVTLSTGSINGNTDNGVAVWSSGENASITLSGTEIKNNGQHGVNLQAKDTKFTMESGTIADNGEHGIRVPSSAEPGITITMTGGAISGNGQNSPNSRYGISVEGKSATLDINGGTINGNTGDNSNKSGAVSVPTKKRTSAVNTGDTLKAQINADGNGLTSSSGTWN